MASGRILNSQITASSIYDSNHQGYEARLNNYKVWCTNNNNAMQYVQVKHEIRYHKQFDGNEW